jgi:hypothetical protein
MCHKLTHALLSVAATASCAGVFQLTELSELPVVRYGLELVIRPVLWGLQYAELPESFNEIGEIDVRLVIGKIP